jgi:histidinol-phosphate phosphatase family protein
MGPAGSDIPKAMLEFDGTPLIEHQLKLLARHGIRDVVLCLGHGAERIRDAMGDGDRLGLTLRYSVETEPLGTAGAVAQALPLLADEFLVLYSDLMLDMDLDRLFAFHRNSMAVCTLVVHPNDHPEDSDLVELGPGKRVIAFHRKPRPLGLMLPNLANSALFVMSKQAMVGIEPDRFMDFGADVFPRLVLEQPVFGYVTPEYIKDIGTPERYLEVTQDVASGRVSRLHSRNPRCAVFLDRDGIINEDRGLIHDPDQFQLLPGVSEAILRINRSDFLAIVVTNQSVVARNLCSMETVDAIHRKMEALLARDGAWLDAVHFCPHHPDSGYPGENSAYKVACECRKPGIGMILRARGEFNIDLPGSFMIGDSWRDIMAGRNAGMPAIRVGPPGADDPDEAVPDAAFDTLAEAVDHVLRTANGRTAT